MLSINFITPVGINTGGFERWRVWRTIRDSKERLGWSEKGGEAIKMVLVGHTVNILLFSFNDCLTRKTILKLVERKESGIIFCSWVKIDSAYETNAMIGGNGDSNHAAITLDSNQACIFG